MRSSAAALFCLLVVQPFIRAEIETENHVLILTNENFDEAIKNHRQILVFFVPSDRESWRALAADYAKAAVELAKEKSELRLGEVDCTKQNEIKERFKIVNDPALEFFREGRPVKYHGRQTVPEIIHWLKKISATPPAEISTPAELTAFKDANKVAVVGLFKDRESEAAKAFVKVAVTNGAPFGISSDDAVYAAAEAEDGQVVLYKKFDEGRNVLEKVGTVENLRDFVAVYSLPLVIDPVDKLFFTSDDEWISIEMSILLLIDKRIVDYEKISANFRESAKQFRGTVDFMTVHSDHPEYIFLMMKLGLKESDGPRIRMIRLQSHLDKFKPDDETNLEPAAISAFVQAVFQGEIKPYFRSQDLPEDWDKAPVKVLVRTNFDKIAFDKSKNVLVGFYYPDSAWSYRLSLALQRLGEHFRDNSQVVIAKIDPSANELDHVDFGWGTYVALKLYKKNTNEVVEYDGAYFFEELKKFVETNSDYGEAPDEGTALSTMKDDTLRFFLAHCGLIIL